MAFPSVPSVDHEGLNSVLKSRGVVSDVSQFLNESNLEVLVCEFRQNITGWRRTLTETSRSSETITQLQPTDVLFGRGNQINSIPGNWLFRQVVALNQIYYNQILVKEEKSTAGDAMVLFFELVAGTRFLEACEDAKNGGNPAYRKVDPKRKVEKFKQALRERGLRQSGIAPLVRKMLQTQGPSGRTEVSQAVLSNARNGMGILRRACNNSIIASEVTATAATSPETSNIPRVTLTSPKTTNKKAKTTTSKKAKKIKKKVKTKSVISPSPKAQGQLPLAPRGTQESTDAALSKATTMEATMPFKHTSPEPNNNKKKEPQRRKRPPAKYFVEPPPRPITVVPPPDSWGRQQQTAGPYQHHWTAPSPQQEHFVYRMATSNIASTMDPNTVPHTTRMGNYDSQRYPPAARQVSPSMSVHNTPLGHPTPSPPPLEPKPPSPKEVQQQAKVHAEELRAFQESFLSCKRYAHDIIRNFTQAAVERYPVDEQAETLVKTLQPAQLRNRLDDIVPPMPVFAQDDDDDDDCPVLLKRI